MRDEEINLQRFKEIAKSHREETEDDTLQPDLCDTCWLIYNFEKLLKLHIDIFDRKKAPENS